MMLNTTLTPTDLADPNAADAHEAFYQHLPYIESITGITDTDLYHDVPESWYVALTDIMGSTKAIEAGRYKEVNALAAASITALLNHIPTVDLPFVFGGDGATILIPPTMVEQAKEALIATKQLALEAYAMNLRIGIVPVSEVYRAGYKIRVVRLKMSENFYQAIFTGGGLSYAEKLLKNPQSSSQYALTPQPGQKYHADFSGFECRWNAIRSPYDETVSLLVMVTHADSATHIPIYREVLRQIERIYGDRVTRHPITLPRLQMAWNPLKFKLEAKIRYNDLSFSRLWTLTKNTFLARVAMRFDLKGWGKYPQLLIEATDNEKFDDTLRMIISGTSQQQQALRHFLEQQRQLGDLVYGIHTSQHALVTCLVFDHFGRQVHFVDGADGGYALAAKELKAQYHALGGYPMVQAT